MENITVPCPVCDAAVSLPADTQASEIVSCAECKTRLVVARDAEKVSLSEAPAIEEDWGQ